LQRRALAQNVLYFCGVVKNNKDYGRKRYCLFGKNTFNGGC
jgi:hypothetical protein